MPLTAVLIIDDEPKIRALLREALQGEAEQVFEASTGRAAVALAEAKRPDLVVLDLGLPDIEGIEVCRAIRAWSSAPILVLSARASEDEKAALLDAGADDYMTKPFSIVEFQARVRAQARRSRMGPVPGTDAPITIRELTIDTARRRVERGGVEVHLTPTEWAVLRALIAHAGQPVTHAQLFKAVWGSATGDAHLYLRVYVAHLRRKLEGDPYQPCLILTEPGIGYRLVLAP
ncbi:MAG TPA: response regulator transcription factor [Gemmatimonadaceae bacterium]|jgi:two-component system KDP operon response regulator KdpE|nr:response regulator transcription factor [Gemmatimonadaceae bacterium]